MRSLEVVGGNLDQKYVDDDADVSHDDGLLGHLYQGARDRDWALGPLIDKQIEKTLTYELDRATAILGTWTSALVICPCWNDFMGIG